MDLTGEYKHFGGIQCPHVQTSTSFLSSLEINAIQSGYIVAKQTNNLSDVTATSEAAYFVSKLLHATLSQHWRTIALSRYPKRIDIVRADIGT